MSKRQSGTYRRGSEASEIDDNDPRLRAGTLVLVEDGGVQARTLRKCLEGVHRSGPPVAVARSLGALRDFVHPPRRGLGRQRVRGFIIDFHLDRAPDAGLERPSRRRMAVSTSQQRPSRATPTREARGGENALDVIEWLRRVYPRTPVVVYTGADLRSLSNATGEAAHFVETDHRLRQYPTGKFESAMLGVLELRDGTQAPVLNRVALTPRVLSDLDQRVFAEWDRRCTSVRRWLLEELGPLHLGLKEYLLCTLDAYFESLALSELAEARGVSQATIDQNLKELRALWEQDLDQLRARWERSKLGRGVREPARVPWASPPEDEPEKPTSPSSPRGTMHETSAPPKPAAETAPRRRPPSARRRPSVRRGKKMSAEADKE